jgi:hypothetical protein
VLLDELRGRLPVERGALRDAEGAVEVPEERLVSERVPPAVAVERCERDEELREGVVLATEQVGEAG